MNPIRLNDSPEKEIIPGYFARFLHTPNVTLAYWRILAGAALPEHSHHHEQIANVIEGQFLFNLNGEEFILNPGDAMTVPPNAKHSGKALTPCRLIDVFHPMREDYKNK